MLDLPSSATPKQVKQRFYALAKTTHPDVATDEDPSTSQHSFVEIHAAFEMIMHEADLVQKRSGSTPSSSARRTTGPGRPRRAGEPPRPSAEAGTTTLADLLCERLAEEPHAVREVWDEIVEQQLRVRESVLEALFRACGSTGGGGLPTALDILRDARNRQLLTKATREAAAIFIIKCARLSPPFRANLARPSHAAFARAVILSPMLLLCHIGCKEDSSSFSKIMNELGEEDKSPEARETLAYANALYSGLSEGYSG